jgi:hypothetical protein
VTVFRYGLAEGGKGGKGGNFRQKKAPRLGGFGACITHGSDVMCVRRRVVQALGADTKQQVKIDSDQLVAILSTTLQ